jgi:hypothetical protein
MRKGRIMMYDRSVTKGMSRSKKLFSNPLLIRKKRAVSPCASQFDMLYNITAPKQAMCYRQWATDNRFQITAVVSLTYGQSPGACRRF